MKNIFLFTLLFFYLKAASQPSFELLPSPQQFDYQGLSKIKVADIESDILKVKTVSDAKKIGSGPFITAQVDNRLDIEKEGYVLKIEGQHIQITGKDEAGLFYGFQSLKQLVEDAKAQNVNLPECKIRDYPLLAYRPIHFDIKHHMEKWDYYYQTIDRLASYKINAVIVELEDKLQYKLQPKVGSKDAKSIEEWRALSEYALSKNIRMSPLVQGLGHASFILKHPEYEHLRDNPDSDWAFNPLDSATYKVQFDLYRDAFKALPHGNYLHVGGDEVHTTGRNSGKSALELQLIWLNKVSEFAEEHNRTPIVWDDMPLEQAGLFRATRQANLTQEQADSLWTANSHILEEFLEQFPKNTMYMRWNYGNPNLPGNIKAMQWYEENGLEVIGATAGQTRWVLMPQNESNIANIRSFALISIENNLEGLFLTLWDDDSPHFELFWRGILAFSEYSWAGDKRSKEELKRVYRHREFDIEVANEQYAFIDDLEQPVAFWKNALLHSGDRNRVKTMNNPAEEAIIRLPDFSKPGVWSETYKEKIAKAKEMQVITSKVSETIQAIKTKKPENMHRLEVYNQVNKLVSFTNDLLLLMEEADLLTETGKKRFAFQKLMKKGEEFQQLRTELEDVYGKTRILNKPDDYFLDSDYHHHLSNQSIDFDWQFYPEMLLFKKIHTGLEF